MPLTLKSIKGNVTLPNGSGPTSGLIVTRLSEEGIVYDGTKNHSIGGRKVWSVPSGGNLDSSPIALVPNDLILPIGTYYIADLRLIDANGQSHRSTRLWDVLGTGNINIADVAIAEPATQPEDNWPPPRVTTATKPAASALWAGKFIRVKDPSGVETLEFCFETAPGGSYSWEVIGSGPAL